MKTDIIILSKTEALVSTALASICKHVDKDAVGRIVIGWTGSFQPAEQDTEAFGFDVTIDALDTYNFAANNNYLVEKHCLSECVLFINDDIELVEDSVSKCLKWLDNKDVGTVGIKLLYPDKTIQHAGQFVAIKNGKYVGCGHAYWKQPDMKLPPFMVIGNTCAFCMMRKSDFLEVGGFDERYQHSFEDVQLNLQIAKLGKQNICDNTTWAWHAESQTRKQASSNDDQLLLKKYVEANLDIFMPKNEEEKSIKWN